MTTRILVRSKDTEFAPLMDARGKPVESGFIVESVLKSFVMIARGNFGAKATRAAIEEVLPLLVKLQEKFTHIKIMSTDLKNDFESALVALVGACKINFVESVERESENDEGKAKTIEL